MFQHNAIIHNTILTKRYFNLKATIAKYNRNNIKNNTTLDYNDTTT